MKYLSQTSKELFSGKRVIVRLDLNVPLTDGAVLETDADRIRKALPTLEWLKEAGAMVIIISHIGRDPKENLQPVAEYMGIPLMPLMEFSGNGDHQVVMLENLRSNPGEESNDPIFAKQLASYADIYVNDGFSVSHRPHASVVGIPEYLPAYAGFQMEQEVTNLNRALHPDHPAILIMGGAKFETKLPVITSLLPKVDQVVVGGALANNFFKERGFEVGQSLIDTEAKLGDLVHDPKVILPTEVIVQSDAETDHAVPARLLADVTTADRIVDVILPETAVIAIKNAATIIWNGPMGNYENGYTKGTEDVARAISESNAFSMVGGGDSIALIEKLDLEKDFGFLSTGGGAMLEYLAHEGRLPGILALEKSA